MQSHNPYEDFDAIDPYEGEDDETGSFEFVEDEYRSIPDAEGDGLDGENDAAQKPDITKTVVRPRAVLRDTATFHSVDGHPYQGQQLKRDHGRSGHRRQQGQPKTPHTMPPLPQVAYRQDRSHASAEQRVRLPRRYRRKHRLLRLMVLIALVVGAYWLVAHPIDDRLAFSEAEQRTLNGELSLYVPSTPSYILALGSDAREGEDYSRTDTMILMRVDFWGSKISLLSIPRDTMVEIEGQGTNKINAAYAFGGAGGAVRAVRQLTGAHINHVAVVHFEELADLIDYLGGLTVNVPQSVYDPEFTGLYLEEGMQTLDGATAVLWARTRYGYDNGDFGRQENQRILMTALVNRVLSLSPRQFPRLVDELSDLVGTDMRCYNLLPLLVRFKLQKPTIYSASVPYTDTWVDGVSYVEADRDGLARIMRAMDEGRDPSAAL